MTTKKFLRATKYMKKRGKVADQWIVTKHKWLEQNKAEYYWCHYCSKMLTKSQMELDHKESRSRRPDLRFVLTNLVPSCHTCNSLKGSRSHDEFCQRCAAIQN